MGLLFSKASTTASGSRPNWARVYSTAVGVRGGAAATAEAVGGLASTASAAETSSASTSSAAAAAATESDPFQHLPGIEVCYCCCCCCRRLRSNHVPNVKLSYIRLYRYLVSSSTSRLSYITSRAGCDCCTYFVHITSYEVYGII